MIVLPTLQKTIRRAFLRLVLLFGVLGVLLLAGIFFAGRMPTLLVRMNYDSIAYAQAMKDALNGLQFPEDFPQYDRAGWKQQFQQALTDAASNVTEAQESQIIQVLTERWKQLGLSPSPADCMLLRETITTLIHANEQGMFHRLDRNVQVRNLCALGAAIAFFVGTLWALLLADSIATRIAHPLRRAAGVLQERPSLRRRLSLPDPQALEVRILFDELTRLWGRLGQLEALNVEKLLAEKQKLEVILDSADDAVLVLDSTGCVAHVSTRMLTLLSLEKRTLLGQPWTDLASASPDYLTLRGVLRVAMQGTQELVLRGSGEERLYAARRRDLRDSEGHTVGQVFLLSNVTEKRRREALRSEMMDWISHELKTPMQSLGLAADLLLRRPDLDTETRLLVDIVHQDASRLRIVAQQFMDIARMSPLALQLVLEEVDLIQCLAVWLMPLQLIARESEVTLVTETRLENSLVTLDKERFAWVISNLVSNALRASPVGTEVCVSLGIEEDAQERLLALAVSDRGTGIAPELVKRLFEPYSHGRTAGRHEGLVGLGLAIASTIVEAHGGTLRYAPREGGGSVFTVLLPLAQAAPQQEQKALVSQASGLLESASSVST